MQQMWTRFDTAIVRMLATAREPLTTDPQLIASMLQGPWSGSAGECLNAALQKNNSRHGDGNSYFLRAHT